VIKIESSLYFFSLLRVYIEREVQEAWFHRSRHLLQSTNGSGTGLASDVTTDSLSSDSPLTSDGSSATMMSRDHKTQPTTSSTSSSSQPQKLVEILAGTLIAMVIIILGFLVAVIVLILVLVKINRRRKLDRELVTRTKQDIFEGVPSGVTPEEMSSISKYNVDSLLTSSPGKTSSDEGEGLAEEVGLNGFGVEGVESGGNEPEKSSST